MPIYFTTLNEGSTTESQRAQIAEDITHTHVEVTGAPIQFVNAFFREHADDDGGFRELPQGKMAIVSGNIRAGRDNEGKAKIVNNITQSFVDTLGCAWDEVEIKLNDVRADYGMEEGKILPVPGSPEEEEWKRRGKA